MKKVTLIKKIKKRQRRVRPIKWLKLNLASCVVHLYCIYEMVFVKLHLRYGLYVHTVDHFYGIFIGSAVDA